MHIMLASDSLTHLFPLLSRLCVRISVILKKELERRMHGKGAPYASFLGGGGASVRGVGMTHTGELHV